MKEEFYRSVVKIAVPVACQSLLQSLLGAVDQLMIGQMGGTGIAGVGLGGKFASLYQVLLGAVATAAGIMIAQYMGQKNEEEVSRSFFANLGIAAALPLYAGIAAVLANTGLNYLLIFGKWGFPAMGVRGAALARVLSQTAACVLTLVLFFRHYRRQALRLTFCWRFDGDGRRRYLTILLPLLICEFVWSLGENTYAAIYGNMGTAECAAMTLTYPVQGLLIGVLSGLSQAAGILIGKSLGEGAYERAGRESKKLMILGAAAAFLWNLSIPWVYFLLSLEECLRLGISLVVFRKGIWQNRLRGAAFRK